MLKSIICNFSVTAMSVKMLILCCYNSVKKYLKLSMQASWPQMQPEIEKVLEVVAMGDIGEGMEGDRGP